MAKQQKLVPILLLGVVVLAIILLSNGLSQVKFESGDTLDLLDALAQKLKPAEAAPSPPLSEDLFISDAVLIMLWVMFALSLVLAIVSPKYRKTLLRTFVLWLILLLLFSNFNPGSSEGEEISASQQEPMSLEQPDVEFPETPDFVENPPNWVFWGVNIALTLAFLGAIWLFWRLFRSKPDTQTLLVQEAETALDDLLAGRDLKDAVLRCYAGMSEVLHKSQKIEREKAMTPREFETHLAEAGLRDEHIQRLTRLFEGVRYGARPSGGRIEREAMDCLRAIVHAYGNAS